MKAPLTEDNLKWFQRVRDWIRLADRAEEHADENGVCPFPLWDQEGWRQIFDRYQLDDMEIRPKCGAAFCQAGYVAEAAGGEWVNGQSNLLYAEPADHEFFDAQEESIDAFSWSSGRATIHTAERAQRLLGISASEANYMFYGPTNVAVAEQRIDEILTNHGQRLPETP